MGQDYESTEAVVAASVEDRLERMRAENERLRMLLQRTHEAWSWEANQGDGIDERNGEVWETVRYALTGICNHGREDMSRCRTCETALTPEAK